MFLSPIAYANDTTARVGAGGITFLKNEEIRLLQEELEISTKSVMVLYKFRNESNADIRTTVAFPMPTYGWNPGESALDANEKPLIPFKVWVNDQEISTKTNRRALIGGLDITEQLRNLGLSEKQIFQTFGDCEIEGCKVNKVLQEKISKLASNGEIFPQWKIAETIYWEQVFPKGKEIQIKHKYSPFVGYSYNYPFQDKWLNVRNVIPAASDRNANPKDRKEACIDEATRKAVINKVNALVKHGATMVDVYLQDVEYVLGTGRNWKGPIGDFKLRIKKESADQLVTLCFPGKAKIVSPLIIEFTQTNFVPQDKLIVYFIDVGKSLVQ